MTARPASPAEARFRLLFVEHHDAVARFVRRRLPEAEVDDVVAETFLVAWRRLGEVPLQPRAWLLGVARNVGANRSRSTRRQRALAERLAAQPQAASDGLAADAEDADQPALRAFAHLTATDRETLALVSWDELSPREAASVVDCTYAAFRVRLHRARRRLEAGLEEELARGERSPKLSRPPVHSEIGDAR